MTIQRLLDALVDDQRIDWDEAERQAPDDDSRRTIRELRVVAGIHSAHQGGAGRTEGSVAVPFQWGPLQVRAFVARGAHGDVYRAWDARLERHVALKLLHHDAPSDPAERGPIAEGRLLARVRQENVVTVYGADRIDGRAGVWMELVEGLTIREQVDAHGPLAAEVAAAVACAVLSGLGAIHRAGLIHRDIKAQNVVQADGGRTILMDLGAGQESDAPDEGIEGTPVYLAPELLNGAAATIASDVYATGVLLYYMLTGRYPVDGVSLDELRQKHATRETASVVRGIEPRFARVIVRALAPDPRQRFESAQDMKAAVEQATRPAARGWAIPAAALLIATMLGVWVVDRWWTPAPPTPVIARSSGPEPVQSLGPTVSPAAAVQAAAPTLTFEAPDWVLIAAFDNRTGEPLLDDTIAFAFGRELSNSAFVHVVPRERVDDVLHLMRKPADTRIDARVGREICLRDGGIHALITGFVGKDAGGYVLSSQIVDPRDGATAKSLSDRATTATELLPAVRRQALAMREALGEMRSDIHLSEAALERVTTPSLAALQLYSRASSLMHGENWDNAAAEKLLRQAVAEDGRFASAYILLAWTLANQGRPPNEVMSVASTALELAPQTGDSERYVITGGYYSMAATRSTGAEQQENRRRAIAAYKSLLRINPGHYWGVYNLFVQYEQNHQEPEATQALMHAAEVRSTSVSLRLSLANRLLQRGDLAGLRGYIRQLEDVIPKDPAARSPVELSALNLLHAGEAWITQDVARVRHMADQVLNAVTTGGVPALPLLSMYAGLGRFEDYKQLVVPLLPQGARDAGFEQGLLGEAELRKDGAVDALREFLATRSPSATVALSKGPLAFGLLKLDRFDEARTSMAPLAGTPDHAWLEAFIACREGRVEDGIHWFAVARERGVAGGNAELHQAWAIADGWKRVGNTEAAIATLETALRNRWPSVVGVQFGVALWIQDRDLLGDLYRDAGRLTEAAAIDRELEMLLAVADPDFPVLVRLNARKRSGILQDARSFGIGAILANQGLEDLKSGTGFDLGPTVLTNTRAKFMFTSPNQGEYYVFVQRGKGLTRARPYPAKNDPG